MRFLKCGSDTRCGKRPQRGELARAAIYKNCARKCSLTMVKCVRADFQICERFQLITSTEEESNIVNAYSKTAIQIFILGCVKIIIPKATKPCV